MGPAPPPTRPAPSGPVDPFNCAVDPENTWATDKKEWCCRIHHVGCPQPIAPIIMPAPQPIAPAPPADPYNCADGFANWQAGWSVAKKAWCCSNEGKGCPPAAGGCAYRACCTSDCEVNLRVHPDRCSTGIRAIFRCASSVF